MARADAITDLLDRATALYSGPALASGAAVGALVDDLDALGDRDLARFDARARRWATGWRAPDLAIVPDPLWRVLALVSADGHDRERAVRSAPLRRATVGLIALRATDWVAPVRIAALDRLADVPAAMLLDALALLDAVARERSRGAHLDALVEHRLADGDLRAATHAEDPRARRAAWRRLAARGACTADELRLRVVRDDDVVVRALAADAMAALGEDDRRVIAVALAGDRIGRLAARGLAALVALDGAAPIHDALVAPSTALRRQARAWAAVRGVDARAIYAERLAGDPYDGMARIALAEIGDPADREILVWALQDPRSRVRAAALRAVAALDPAAGRAAALSELSAGRAGRVGRAAATVLRDTSLGDAELSVLEAITADARRPAGPRLRALSLLRRARWRHLAALLRLRAEQQATPQLDDELDRWLAASATLGRAPDDRSRATIEALRDGLDAPRRQALDFVLHTAR